MYPNAYTVRDFESQFGASQPDSVVVTGESWQWPANFAAEPLVSEIGTMPFAAAPFDARSYVDAGRAHLAAYCSAFGTAAKWIGTLPFHSPEAANLTIRVDVRDLGVCAMARIHLPDGGSVTIAVVPRHRALVATPPAIRRELGDLEWSCVESLRKTLWRAKHAECVRHVAAVYGRSESLKDKHCYAYFCITLIRAMVRWLTARDAAAHFEGRAA